LIISHLWYYSGMLRRNISAELQAALAESPVVLVSGARQTGKSTLVAESAPAENYITFDDLTVARAATADPQGFIQSLTTPAVLDEVQHVPEIFRPIKLRVDRERRAGSFVLTGSANVMLLPRVSESLAGRMQIVTLWPLSQGEIEGVEEHFIDEAFSDGPPRLAPSTMDFRELVQRMVTGGFPEVATRAAGSRNRGWFRSYGSSVIQRQVLDISQIEAAGDLPRLLSLVAARATGLVNTASLANDMGIPATTMKRYVNLLRATYILQTLPAWTRNLGMRVVRTEKLTLLDTGLLAFLQNTDPERIVLQRDMAGPLVETFVMMELRKHLGWSEIGAELYFFRTHGGMEVDFVLEAFDGRVVAIEVKATTTFDKRDTRGLEFLREHLGSKFIRGIVLYTGEHVLPAGERIWAVPMDALWRWGARPNGD
jgi:uncharacterized protein